jgi:hypothetical protein
MVSAHPYCAKLILEHHVLKTISSSKTSVCSALLMGPIQSLWSIIYLTTISLNTGLAPVQWSLYHTLASQLCRGGSGLPPPMAGGWGGWEGWCREWGSSGRGGKKKGSPSQWLTTQSTWSPLSTPSSWPLITPSVSLLIKWNNATERTLITRHRWLMPVILATQKAKIRRILV